MGRCGVGVGRSGVCVGRGGVCVSLCGVSVGSVWGRCEVGVRSVSGRGLDGVYEGLCCAGSG